MTNKIEDILKKMSNLEEGKVDIKGKEYSTVPLRVELFRANMDAIDVESVASIFTKVVFKENKVITRAYLAEQVDVIFTEEGKEIVQMKNVKSVGTSEEDRDAHRINQTSAVENSETSAVGRMLANLGLHGGQIASAEEVSDALDTQRVIGLTPKNMNEKKFLRLAGNCKTVEDVNKLLIQQKGFFDDLKKTNVKTFKDLKLEVEKLRKKLSGKEGEVQ
ncbi:MAG: hypothetical protein CMB55_07885 [Euryarchaeota archaeon]|nr:hypothetical protein [Euryarchaeota archaeon]